MITDPVSVVVVLLTILAVLFGSSLHPWGQKVFKVVPLLVFAYFTPTILSNLGIIPLQSPAYAFIKKWFLPASLVLLTLSIDLPSIMKLGKKVIILFLTGTVTIMLGGPLAYLLVGGFIPAELHEQVWKGLAALCGSWTGGGANFIAVGESVGASPTTISMMVIVDVAVAGLWMMCLFFFAGKEKEMDEKIGADRKSIDVLRDKLEAFYQQVVQPANLASLMIIFALSLGVTALAIYVSGFLPNLGSIVSGFTWIVIFVTVVGISLSFTPVRKLEGAGASKVGSVFLYLLIAAIGAGAEFSKVFDIPLLVLIGAIWMMLHAVIMLVVRKKIKAPIFFLAVGSQANVGAAASAPIVASAFHPSLAPVGVLLGVLGYGLGTYAGLFSAFLLEQVSRLFM